MRDGAAGTDEGRDTDVLFVFIDADHGTGWPPAAIARDRGDCILTGRNVREAPAAGWSLARDPYLLETSVPGIFAAGDVRHAAIKRVASGVGEGSMAIAFVHQHPASDAYG